MTRQEAIEVLQKQHKAFMFCDAERCIDHYKDWKCEKCDEALKMAIEALEKEQKWIPVSWHETTEEERAENGYPKDWEFYLDCEMPVDGQRILVTTSDGFVEQEESCVDGNIYYTENGLDWIYDIIAWMPLPEPYEEAEE